MRTDGQPHQKLVDDGTTSISHKNIYDRGEDFWQKYLKGRPQVPETFFQRIFTYHAQHGGSFATVHDAGAGVGVHSARLITRFEKVLVTDPSEKNVEIARQRLTGVDYDRYEFKVSKLEQTINFPAASVDMVFAAVMMHFTDLDEAMAAVAHQLKPEGTFVAAGFGYAVLEDEAAQNVWLKLWQKGSKKWLKGLGMPVNERLNLAIRIGASHYDAIPVLEKHFQPGALRLRLNWPGDEWWSKYCVPEGFEDQFPHWSQVGQNDVVSTESEDGWGFEMDLDSLRGIFKTYPDFDLESDDMRQLWRELQSLVGDHKVKGHWPAFLILATSK